MRSLTAYLVVILILALMAFESACGAGKGEEPSAAEGGTESEVPLNSGKQLVGDFQLKEVDDSYGRKGSQTPSVVYSFNSDGGFKRMRTSTGVSRVEEGGYIIDTAGVLILYVERVDGRLLESARAERYSISESGDNIRLSYRSVSLVLQRTSS